MNLRINEKEKIISLASFKDESEFNYWVSKLLFESKIKKVN